MQIFLTIAHTLAYALIQAFGFTFFTLALQRLGKIRRLYLRKAFFYLLLVNAAGTMNFGEEAWQRASTPVAALFFLLGMAFFIGCHLCLACRQIRKKKESHAKKDSAP